VDVVPVTARGVSALSQHDGATAAEAVTAYPQ